MNRPSLRTRVAVGLIATLGGIGTAAWRATHDSAPAAQPPASAIDTGASAAGGPVAEPAFGRSSGGIRFRAPRLRFHDRCCFVVQNLAKTPVI